MKPNESPIVGVPTGEPIAADPVEVLAYALWNDGKKDEAIAVLERQIALEKKLAHGALPSPMERAAEMVTFPAAIISATPPPPASTAANQNGQSEVLRLAAPVPQPAPVPRPAPVPQPVPVIGHIPAEPRRLPAPLAHGDNAKYPGWRLALVCALFILMGVSVLWALSDRDSPSLAEQPRPAAPAVASTPADTRPEQAAARGTETAAPPAQAEPPPDEPPAEFEEAALDGSSDSGEEALPQPRIPRSRAEPPAASVSQPEPVLAEPPPVRQAATPSSTPDAAAADPPPPASDARSERSRRLAERRRLAEEYVARRRAAAERRAGAPPPGEPTRRAAPDGPRILYGGRGIPN